MGGTIYDDEGEPYAWTLDIDEARNILDLAAWAEQIVQKRRPGAMLPDRLARTVARLQSARTTGHRLAADGQHPAVEVRPDDILDVRAVMQAKGIPERTARRICERHGSLVAGRRVISRSVLELVR